MSTLDLTKGYWQVNLLKKTQHSAHLQATGNIGLSDLGLLDCWQHSRDSRTSSCTPTISLPQLTTHLHGWKTHANWKRSWVSSKRLGSHQIHANATWAWSRHSTLVIASVRAYWNCRKVYHQLTIKHQAPVFLGLMRYYGRFVPSWFSLASLSVTWQRRDNQTGWNDGTAGIPSPETGTHQLAGAEEPWIQLLWCWTCMHKQPQPPHATMSRMLKG